MGLSAVSLTPVSSDEFVLVKVGQGGNESMSNGTINILEIHTPVLVRLSFS